MSNNLLSGLPFLTTLLYAGFVFRITVLIDCVNHAACRGRTVLISFGMKFKKMCVKTLFRVLACKIGYSSS